MTDLSIVRGDDKTWNIRCIDSDGTAIDITGYVLYFTVKDKRTYQNDSDDDDALISKTITTHSDPTRGISSIVISASDTASLKAGTYVFDLQLKDGGGNFKTPLIGNFEIQADVTRRTS